MALRKALREAARMGAADVALLVPAGRLNIGGHEASLTLEADASPQALAERGWLSVNDVRIVHIIDPEFGAEAGRVWLRYHNKDSPASAKYISGLAKELEQLLPASDSVAGSLSLVRNMLRLGYRLGPRSPFFSPPAFRNSKYLHSFSGVYTYTYRELLTIDAGFFFIYPGSHGEEYLDQAEIRIYSSRRGATISGDDLLAVAARALGSLRSKAEVRKGVRRSYDPSSGEVAEIVEVRIDAFLSDFKVGDYLAKYIPGVARKVKEYVDSKVGQAQAEPA